MKRQALITCAVWGLLQAFAWATPITNLNVSCNQVTGKFSLSGGVAGVVTITFENAVSLNADSLYLDASLVTPGDPTLQSRLPDGFFVPEPFPVLLTVVPGGSGVAFLGHYSLEVETENLVFSGFTSFRLLQAPNSASSFQDVTASYGIGSFRVLAGGGSFSQFIIAADMRPPDVGINEKLQRFNDLVNANTSIDPSVASDLLGWNSSAAGFFAAGDVGAAINAINGVLDTIEVEAGDGIPAVYNQGEPSVAGVLFGSAKATKLALAAFDQNRLPQTAAVEVDLTTAPSAYHVWARASFEGAQALDLEAMSITALEVNPSDPTLLARLPGYVSIPTEFPVLIDVDPGPATEQVFRGMWSLELRTEELAFDTGLRLFKAETSSSPFHEVTRTMGIGSFRVLAGGGSFSQFIIGRDGRTPSDVTSGKFADLDSYLSAHQSDIDVTIYGQLSSKLAQAWSDYGSDLLEAVLNDLATFEATVAENAGNGIPDTWHEGGSVVNVAAELTAKSESLRFSVVIEKDQVDPADVNRDGTVNILDVFAVIGRVF